ncbi:MAG: prepilin peptidase, partial [Kiritimatiellaeota bacterium]|nr:prepilin peptidase [Kiritimatiellota bacterium]
MPIRDFVEQAFPLLTVFAFVFGACIGSFLNVCIWRLPRGESLVHPGSHCPRCGHEICPWENIPLVSWVLLRGRCSSCGLPISVRYPLVEGATALLFVLLWLRVYFTGLPLAVLPGYFVLGAVLLAAAVIDSEHTLIPDALTLFGLAGAVVLAVLLPESHPLAGGPGGMACPEHFWSLAVLDLLRGQWPNLAGVPRVGALLDAVLGGLVGMASLWAIRELARIFWGSVQRRPEQAPTIVLTKEGARIGDSPTRTWREILQLGNRTFSVVVRGARACFTDEAGVRETEEIPEGEERRVVVRSGVVQFGATSRPLA